MGIIDDGADLSDLVSGAARVLLAPIEQAIPATIKDIILMKAPYTVQTNWFDLGATTGPTQGSRAIKSEGLGIEQLQGNVIEDITEITRGLTVPMAGISAENLQVFENASTIGAVAATTGASAQESVKFGSFSEATQYRAVLIGMRPKSAGIVKESVGGPSRGRMVARVLYRVSLAADESTFSVGKGNLASADVSFNAYPEPGQNPDVSHGIWLLEDAGTIA